MMFYLSGSAFGTSEDLLSAINHNERFVIPSSRGGTSVLNLPRKVISLPVSKKFRLLDDNHNEQQNTHYIHHNPIQSAALSQSQPSHFSHAHPDLTTTTSTSVSPQTRHTARTSSSNLLSPCHICHRKPTRKSDLDSYADCMGCGERTCFVCLRACQGWLPTLDESGPGRVGGEEEDLSASFTMRDADDEEDTQKDSHRDVELGGPEQRHQRLKQGEGGNTSPSWNGRGHRAVICSRCCIERGSEGDVVCLGCLAGMEGA